MAKRKLPSDYLASGWTNYAFSETRLRNSCTPWSRHAVAWCYVGAIRAAEGKGAITPTQASALIARTALRVKGLGLSIDTAFKVVEDWNDVGRTQQEAVDMMEEQEIAIGLRKE